MERLATTLSQIPSGESFIDRLNTSSRTRAAMRKGMRLVEEEDEDTITVEAKATECGPAVYCNALIGGAPRKVIIDSDSNVFILPESYLRRIGRRVDRPCRPLGKTMGVEVIIGPSRDHLDALILPDTLVKNIFIGTNWLRAHR